MWGENGVCRQIRVKTLAPSRSTRLDPSMAGIIRPFASVEEGPLR